MENARYQHALETELARTIASLQHVEGARVHLAVPRQSAFVRDRRPASASVFVQLKAGKRLEQEQVQSIVNLVASSIPELEASHVTVVDQQGRLLSAPQSDSEAAQREQQFELAHRLEEDYAQRIESIAHAVRRARAACARRSSRRSTASSPKKRASSTGRQPDRAQRADVGTDEQGRRGLRRRAGRAHQSAADAGHGVAARRRDCRSRACTGAAGTAAAGTRLQPLQPLQPQPPRRITPRARATRNYEIDRTLAYTRQPAGRLQRLTVAVLIDNVRTTGQGRQGHRDAAPEPQLERITQLVKDAVGFNAERGDSVNVVNSSFREDAPCRRRRARDSAALGAAAGAGHREAASRASSSCWCSSSWCCSRWCAACSRRRREAPQRCRRRPKRRAHADGAGAAGNQPLAYEQQLAQARTLVEPGSRSASRRS